MAFASRARRACAKARRSLSETGVPACSAVSIFWAIAATSRETSFVLSRACRNVAWYGAVTTPAIPLYIGTTSAPPISQNTTITTTIRASRDPSFTHEGTLPGAHMLQVRLLVASRRARSRTNGTQSAGFDKHIAGMYAAEAL